MRNKPRIAYLITAYNNFNHLKRLLSALDDSGAFFYIHIDKNSPLPTNLNEFQNITFIKRHKVWWAGWSHQQAILNLMKEAVSGTYDYYALLSGADYPIREKEFLYDKLRAGGEFISLQEGFP